ncbi:hypothetical protein PRIPAC_78837 [Pristionchus pacificus]|uniref:Uncharacterized protein n=1 Tax=Pristionchus pacificus TaxID=54126 RepID=A0A2A6CN27_PRIPA|nr:hypothetical protein PRIPAC_78837 [Pristionchus pacificus]|eukprot:PDM79497.1 hypothetical protein PRIPAC_32076 [Pristionchus pacificus]
MHRQSTCMPTTLLKDGNAMNGDGFCAAVTMIVINTTFRKHMLLSFGFRKKRIDLRQINFEFLTIFTEFNSFQFSYLSSKAKV